MNDLRTAAQQALEFICWSQFDPSQSGNLPEPPSTAPQVEASLRAALEQAEPVAVGDSYADLFNALQRIETAAVFLPSFKITHEGGLEAVVQNIVDAIAALAQPRQFTFAPKPPSPPPAPQGYDGTEAGLHDFSWRNHV
jgi:hypothetical protein